MQRIALLTIELLLLILNCEKKKNSMKFLIKMKKIRF